MTPSEMEDTEAKCDCVSDGGVLCVTCRVASLRALGVGGRHDAMGPAPSGGDLRLSDPFTTLKSLISWNG